MQSEQSQSQQKAFQQLKELGFEEVYITKALKITKNLEKASQIILKLADQGPEADLSEFMQENIQPKIESKDNSFGYFPKTILSKAKMLFVVNGQLKMGKGKICAQVGHAVIGAYLQVQEQARYDQRSKNRLQSWQMYGSAKIVVKVDSTKQMINLNKQIKALDTGINTYIVEDAGHTQVKAGSLTVLAIGPVFAEEIDEVTRHLKLL